ncbi:MAG: hypothetical protein H6618_06090 [Deltaproteobacteria bacterium]|nr:hypothetical protein [Deltaproteobacteria bacterium]
MGQLIEIVFEGLTPSRQMEILNELKNTLPNSSQLDTGDSLMGLGDVSEETLSSLFSGSKSRVLTIDADFWSVQSAKVLSPRINLTKYDGDNYEININFEIESVGFENSNDFINLLHKWSKHLADKIHISTYFCGLDPAVDEDTRFFTNDKIGPYRFPE